MFATTATGWLFASFRGWALSYFFLVPLPKLAAESASGVHRIDGWHQVFEWALLILIAVHVAATMLHIFVYRDQIMQRMLPELFYIRVRLLVCRRRGALESSTKRVAFMDGALDRVAVRLGLLGHTAGRWNQRIKVVAVCDEGRFWQAA